MGNRNRTIELSTVPVRAHCPSGGRRHDSIWLRIYDPIFVVPDRTCPLYQKNGLFLENEQAVKKTSESKLSIIQSEKARFSPLTASGIQNESLNLLTTYKLETQLIDL